MMKFLALIGYSLGIAFDCWAVKDMIYVNSDSLITLEGFPLFVVALFSYLLISKSHIILFPQDAEGISKLGSRSSYEEYELEKEILRYAKSGKGELTAVELAVDSNFSVEEIQAGLDALVDIDVAVLKIGERDSRCYKIRGLLSEKEKNEAVAL
ncbi:MAG: hypothetical protein G3M78_04345 [Candidatus Nitrohelix vancouverensis]|uniref:Uncharacterized protein n=1 Tax=Candidatus Nitrohelix vancouverensis TaxID=2705534 RepID=A0A7T0C165_9BACT|nr:MAG: hypothetical protein G3M78_04345 [Candidatus Nitrohelix vancouverensis]